MEHLGKGVFFEIEEWVFELLLGEEERKKEKRRLKLKELESLIFILSELVAGLKGRKLVGKRKELLKLIEKREMVRG